MSNKRIVSHYGKSNSSTNATTFGSTIQDGNSTPNIIQNTLNPASGVLQSYRFIISNTTGAVAISGTLAIIHDLLLDVARCYQFVAHLTIIVQAADGTFYSGQYKLTSGSRNNTLIGTGGYKLETIVKDDGIDQYIPETNIVLSITSSKFVITLTAAAAITTSLDMLNDVTINSFEFSA